MPVATARPSVFPTPLNQDSTLNSEENPAAPGEIIQLFATGQGLVAPAVATGAPAPTAEPLARPELDVEASVGGREASIAFAGLTPGAVGLFQVNLTIPPEAGEEEQEVELSVGGVEAARPARVFIARP